MQDSRHQLILSLIVIFTILQLIILLLFGYTPYPDSEGYIQLAYESITHQEPYPVTSKLNEYNFLWNIGAINITALSLYLFHSITPLLIVYSLMKGIMAWMFYAITKNIFDQKIAFIALILYVIYPANYGESTSVLSELPFMFFIFLGMYLIIVKKWFFIGGMSLAFANWCRPMAIVFLLALCIYMIFKWRNSLKMIAGYVVMIAVIGFASMHRTGLFLYQAKSGWMALMDYSSDHSEKSLEVLDRNDWNVSQKDSAWCSLFIDWVKDHPVEYVSQMPQKLVNTYVSDNVNMCTFIPDKAVEEYMYNEVSMATLIHAFPRFSGVQWLTIANLLIYYLLLIGALASLVYFKPDTYLLPISCILLGTLILLFAGHGEARFHIPFMPFFIMLTATFIHRKYGKSRVD